MAPEMENETKVPPSAPGQDVPARLHFHLTLGAFFLPPLAAVGGWCLAISDVLRGSGSPEQRRWTLILVALVLVDSLVLLGWIWRQGDKDVFAQLTEKSRSGPKSRIGIYFEPKEGPAEPRIDRIIPGLPAEKAGFRVGDLILEIDGSPVKTQKEVVDELGRGEPDVARRIRIARGEEQLALEVVPAAHPRADPVGLFHILAKDPPREWLRNLALFLPALCAGVLAWIIGRRAFGSRGSLWLAVLICLAGAAGVSIAAGKIIEALSGGVSVGGELIGMGVNTLALLGLAAAAARRFPAQIPEPPAELRRSVPKTYFVGVFYLVAGVFRVAMLLMMADLLWFGAKGMSNPIHEIVAGTKLGVGGTLLIIVEAVVLAPLAEEFFFRGFLLPRLLIQKGPVWAVGVSATLFALLHPHYGLYVPIVLVYGVVLGWARLRSGGLAAPVLLHASINALATFAMLSQT
jgi:membrane protease YdiL (CAAX protease family)